jgi:mannose-1-phosphate guanylyltransferase
MNITIFAGGAGTRLWPLSRQNSPKQFEKLKDDKSTLQMAVDRVQKFGFENIFISTNAQYKNLVQEQIPELSADHILTEPARRDQTAAIGLTLLRLKKQGKSGTTAILWADHFMEYPDRFVAALQDAECLIKENPKRFVFFGEKARFANHNLGWIQRGEPITNNVYEFLSWKYRPEINECQKMFASHAWVWNPGYFVFDLDFVLGLYEKFQPEMYRDLQEMVADETKISSMYPKLASFNFDNGIVEKIGPDQAVVINVDLGWSDPGTLYALKESLEPDTQKNYEVGKVISLNSFDSLLYNSEDKKIIAAVGLEGMIVVNTPDALVVVAKEQVPALKELLEKMDKENLGEYL